ncbi:MAG: DNA polymerase II [Ktedonobacterales bacterium]|jgi:DNA polymerase elongation subunit (family B)|nr:MAG: DNA polymerase II [Ktedonobacterales bacterium]
MSIKPDGAESARSREDEWLWGWDATPGIVSVWAERTGRAVLWRREPGSLRLLREDARFRPWLLLARLDDLAHLGERLAREDDESVANGTAAGRVTYRELRGPGHLRYLVSAGDERALETALLAGASARLGRRVARLGELGEDDLLRLPPEEQYLVATGRTYFRELAFDDPHRLQFDLETTGLNPAHDRIFLVSVRDNRGREVVLESNERGLGMVAAEADLIRRLAALIREIDPDVIENHNLHGFDLPFLARRAQAVGVSLILGRAGAPGLRQRPASRGYGALRIEAGEGPAAEENGDEAAGNGAGNGNGGERDTSDAARGGRYTIPGRECIDTLDAVRRYDFAARDLPGHGLKAVARHFGLAAADRVYLEGARIYRTWRDDPETVRHYALDDVREVDGLARLLGGAAFALARMAPRRYERLADAGPATGILDPLLVRAYLRAGEAIPARATGDGTQHTGAALYVFATGVARQVVKADVSSLYPSLMRQYRIGPRGDHLGALLALVDRLVEQRLAAKARARLAPPGSPERHTDEALSAAMKILVNSAYGYMGAVGLTRLADVAAANEVTRRGRALLGLLCRELAQRGATLLEADTDGVYFATPESWNEAEERRLVAEVGALLPPLVRLEFEGRYAAMLSHETKNYALLGYDGALLLRGVAFRSIRAEPYGETFLRQATACLLAGDVSGVGAAFAEMVRALRTRTLPTREVTALVRLTKTPGRYLASRAARREVAYEALLSAGRREWKAGERVRVYRATGGRPALLAETPDGEPLADPRNYDVAHYVRLLRETFAARLARAFTADDFATLFGDPEQPSLFAPPLDAIAPILTPQMEPPAADVEEG